jgi:hypothetical protein
MPKRRPRRIRRRGIQQVRQRNAHAGGLRTRLSWEHNHVDSDHGQVSNAQASGLVGAFVFSEGTGTTTAEFANLEYGSLSGASWTTAGNTDRRSFPEQQLRRLDKDQCLRLADAGNIEGGSSGTEAGGTPGSARIREPVSRPSSLRSTRAVSRYGGMAPGAQGRSTPMSRCRIRRRGTTSRSSSAAPATSSMSMESRRRPPISLAPPPARSSSGPPPPIRRSTTSDVR